MTGAGNDIVSLNAIDVTRTLQYKFYSKILSESESRLYNEFGLAGIPFENFVWLLWSVKESAYKFLQRHNPELIFTPVKFVTNDLRVPSAHTPAGFTAQQTEATGFSGYPVISAGISFGQHQLYSRSLVYRELIYSAVNASDNFENVCWGIRSINNTSAENQSEQVRQFLLHRLKRLYPYDCLTMVKTAAGCPVVLNEGKELSLPVSLAHHDRFVGYSFFKT